MCVTTLVTDHLYLVDRTLRAVRQRPHTAVGQECLSAGFEALTRFAQKYEPERNLPFAAVATKYIRWSMLSVIDREGRRRTVSLDAAFDNDGGACLASTLPDRSADDPAAEAAAYERFGGSTTSRRTKPVSLEKVKKGTPRLDGVPAWAQALRAAMFDAVSEADVKEMVQKQVQNAKTGDLPATKFITGFIMANCDPEKAGSADTLD